MNIVLVGASHKTTPVELRERLAFPAEEIPSALSSLVDGEVVGEATIVSTCNRIEVIAAAAAPERAVAQIQSFIADERSVEPSTLAPHVYARRDRDAVHHLFRVASSLDSLVIGEPQILGQVRDAYKRALDAGTLGRHLSPLFQYAFTVAKRVRTETAIGANAVSVSFAAVELARKIFESLKDKTVLLVGAGEMAELAARHFVEAGVARVLVSNRTEERARALADEFGGDTIAFDALRRGLTAADVVLCSTGAPDYVLRQSDARHALDERRNRPIFMIDISVPRQIEPAVGDLDNVYLFDMDDLQRAVDANLRQREREATAAERIVEVEVVEYVGRMRVTDIGPTVAELKGHLNDIASGEFDRLRRRLGGLSPDQEDAIRTILLPSIINKISHPMIAHMRDTARGSQDEPEGVSIWRRIFRLGGDGTR
jgi:glutamyl-tRNA reductase